MIKSETVKIELDKINIPANFKRDHVHYAFMADHLIANGVTIPVRCKDCKHRIYSDFDGCYVCHHGGFNAINPDHFCSYGERRTDD